MGDIIKNFSVCVIIAFLLLSLSAYLESKFLNDFVQKELITLLVALLAINITTVSIITTKLRELMDRLGGTFDATIKSLKSSVKCQCALLGFAFFGQVLLSSRVFINLWQYSEFGIVLILTAVFMYAINILYDTADAAFQIMDFESKQKNAESSDK